MAWSARKGTPPLLSASLLSECFFQLRDTTTMYEQNIDGLDKLCKQKVCVENGWTYSASIKLQ
jgi:hypothetical protein